jgi:protein-disulfide isomerase
MQRRAASVNIVILVVLAAVVVFAAILISSGGGGGNGGETSASPTPGADVAQQVETAYAGIPQTGIRLGKAGAPATLIEIADLQCPFCAEYSRTAMPSVIKDYVRTGRLNYELRIRSFLGRDSVRAAGAAAAAADANRLYQFADLFYLNQGPENSGYADSAFMRRIASQVPGLDAAKVVAAANDPLSHPAVAGAETFARDIGSGSTPDFFLRVKGQLTKVEPQGTAPADYAKAIDAALAQS